MEKITFKYPEIFINNKRNNKIPISFKFNKDTGYIPLLKVLSAKANGSEDFFLGDMRKYTYYTSIRNEFNIFNTHNVIKHIRKRRVHERNVTVLSMLSLLSINDDENYIINEISVNRDISKKIMTNKIDIFALAVIKKEKIKFIEFSKHSIVINSDDIKILFSKEKFVNPSYMKSNNNSLLRSHIIREFRKLPVTIENVTEEEIRKYYDFPYSFKSNSFMEIMKKDKEIKERVISQLKGQLIV